MTTTLRRRLWAGLFTLILLIASSVPATLSATAAEGRAVVTTAPTGYTRTEDVVYLSFQKGSYSGVMNWGARGEDCAFLSPMAVEFYAGDYAYASLSELAGATDVSDVPSSALYAALRDMMVAEHDHIITYQNTRDLYAYTDCVSSESSQLVSFYSGVMHTSVWDAGATWNREHTWPNSKCINTNKTDDSADIMMLRPTLKSENGSRGNKAYGESAGYFDPGESVRGDCARIVLYVYTRWGNTGRMWGTSGVMESMDVLLRWMEEDPVDTWEMGRNDAVESITGTRNVFVDYPEYAWLLFGEGAPADMVTPSGMVAAGEAQPPVTEPADTDAVTEPDFDMTQPDTPPAVDPDFEMTQPEPPPEPDFEMTQPEPPPAPGTEPATGGAEETDGETDPTGCASLASGACMVMILPAAWLLLRRRRENG